MRFEPTGRERLVQWDTRVIGDDLDVEGNAWELDTSWFILRGYSGEWVYTFSGRLPSGRLFIARSMIHMAVRATGVRTAGDVCGLVVGLALEDRGLPPDGLTLEEQMAALHLYMAAVEMETEVSP